MSRLIKFRAWDNESLKYRDQVPAIEEWWDSDCWDDAEQLMDADHAYLALDVGSQFAHRLTWEQYTGLKDRDGREIYEGDIVRFDIGDRDDAKAAWARAKVIFKDGAFRIDHPVGMLLTNPGLTIVGNIHQT